jgi:hypothetical protein
MSDKSPKTGPEENGGLPRAAEDDVEGHSMLPIDPNMARHLANARESEIRAHLKRHDLEAEARRPHKR